MPRVVIIGNAGAGKSTLGRRLSQRRDIRHVEIDRYPWQPGWGPTPEAEYERRHRDLIAERDWIIDGMGGRASIAARVARATEIIPIDMPLWMQFWLAAERQIQWTQGRLEGAPAAIAGMPPTRELFETMWEVDRSWMPGIRNLCSEARQAGKPVTQVESIEDLDRLAEATGRSSFSLGVRSLTGRLPPRLDGADTRRAT